MKWVMLLPRFALLQLIVLLEGKKQCLWYCIIVIAKTEPKMKTINEKFITWIKMKTIFAFYLSDLLK